MKTIKIVLSAFAMLAMVSFTNAQNADKATHMEKVENYIKQLDLTPEQAEKSRELSSKYFDLINSKNYSFSFFCKLNISNTFVL